MAKFDPIGFFKEVRSETARVAWPSRRETLITTGMVFVMVVVASIFFLVADWALGSSVSFLLGLGNG